MNNLRRTRVLFVDIDGTVRKGFDELGRFVNTADDVELYPGMAKLLAAYKADGWRIVAVTNQGGVSLGHVTFEAVLDALAETQRQCGGAFDEIMVCVHHPQATDPDKARCICRKPLPGMLISGFLRLELGHRDETYPARLALMVGDRDEDRLCAQHAGVDFLEAKTWRELGRPVTTVDSHASH